MLPVVPGRLKPTSAASSHEDSTSLPNIQIYAYPATPWPDEVGGSSSPGISGWALAAIIDVVCVIRVGNGALGFAAGPGWDLMGTPPPPTYWGQNVVEHYDGRSWSRAPSLELSMNTGTLGSVTCPASRYCYAIGSGPAQGVEPSSQGLFLALTAA